MLKELKYDENNLLKLTYWIKKRVKNSYEYLKDKAKRNRLRFYYDKNLVSEDFLDSLKPMIEALNEVFNDNWDFEYDILTCRNKLSVILRGVVVRFPQVTIENEEGESYDGIKDLFVLFKIKSYIDDSSKTTNPYIYSVCGGRTTFSFKDYYSYNHSHLQYLAYEYYDNLGSSNKIATALYFSDFCLGSSNLRIHIMESGLKENQNKDFFEQLFVSSFTLVYYESLEGTPYRKMEDMKLPSRSSLRDCSFRESIQKELLLKDIFKELKKSNSKIPLNIQGSKIKVNLDSNTKDIIVKALEDNYPRYKTDYLCYKYEDRFLSLNNDFSNDYSRYLPREDVNIVPYVYKGKEYPLTITDIPSSETLSMENLKLSLQDSAAMNIERHIEDLLINITRNEAYRKTR